MKHLAVVGTALVGGALLLAPTASADVPGTFDVVALAVGVHADSTQQPAASIVTAGLVDLTEAFARSALSSYGTSESSAASLYPGDLVSGGPALLCANFGPCPVDPPAYPLVADAAYPTSPTAGAPGASAHASATETGASSSGASQDAGPVTVGGAVASTRAWVDAAGAHVRTRSVLHDVVVGPLRVGLLEAVDDVDLAADGTMSGRPRVTVSGVTLAGQEASVDDRGVHVAGTSAGTTPPALAEQGLQVRLLGASAQRTPGAVRSAAGGLLVQVSVPVSGVPQLVPGLPGANRRYVGSVLVGGAASVVAAGSETGLQLTVPPLPALGAPGSLVAPPRLAPPPVVAGQPPASAGGGAPPEVAGPLVRLPGVLLYPLASVRGVMLVLLVAPLLALGTWRAWVTRGARPWT